MARQTLIRSVVILTVCGIICKILGAIYRVPLTNILGSKGMGMYYLIFPIYSFMLSLSSSSLPSALSKLVSGCLSTNDSRGAKTYFKCAINLFFVFGVACTLIVIALSPIISSIQNNNDNLISYILIAPAIFCCCIISCFRGYFQGYQNMTYSGVSQIIEQIIKIIFGLILTTYLLKYGLTYAVMGSIIAITISEILALIYLFISFIIFNKKIKIKDEDVTSKHFSKRQYYASLIKTVLPFTLGYIIFPLSSLLDSIFVVKMLEISGVSPDVAISVFGLNNAVVGTLTNLPIVASTAFSVAILPSISYSIKRGNIDYAINKIKVIFKVGLLIILPCVVAFIIFPEQIICIVFGQLNNIYMNELQISAIMLRISSLGILYLTVYQLTTAILQAKDLYYKPCIALAFAVLVKIVIGVTLLLNTNINFFAINIANVVCYIISAFINLYYFDKEFKIEISYRNLFVVPMASCAVMVCCIWFLIGVIGSFLPAVISSIIAFVIGGVIYCWLVISFKAVKMEELLLIKKKS